MTNLGNVGVWYGYLALTSEQAQEIERLGYGTLWLGASPKDLQKAEELLAATTSLTIGTSIVNIWSTSAKDVAEAYHRLEDRYPGRFLLGIGAGHREHSTGYRKPYDALVEYLDELDAAEVPKERRALAALGPRVLELARDRTAGALPYLVTPDHTRLARTLLGDTALLAVEQKVVLADDPVEARAIARDRLGVYLGLTNYVNNLRRLGFSNDDLTQPGSDRFVDALALHGTPVEIAAGLRAHFEAGANHVAVQPLTATEDIMPTLRALAPLLK